MNNCNWTESEIKLYQLGMQYGDYPGNIWGKILSENSSAASVLDIGCGPGGFARFAVNSGLFVQAVDINRKFLKLLKEQVDDSKLLKTYHSDWLDAEIESADITICAYSLSENIRSSEGIKKVLNKTKKTAYFISYVNIEKNEFLAKKLYRSLQVEPRRWKDNNNQFLNNLKELSCNFAYEEIEYDFGVPVLDEIPFNEYINFIANKTGIHDSEIIKNHIYDIMIEKNGKHWLPNIKKSFIVKVSNDLIT